MPGWKLPNDMIEHLALKSTTRTMALSPENSLPNNEQTTNAKARLRTFVLLIIPAITVLSYALLVGMTALFLYPNQENAWSRRADFSTGIGWIGALFSALALAAIVVSIILQRADLSIQSENLNLALEDQLETTTTLKTQLVEMRMSRMVGSDQSRVQETLRFLADHRPLYRSLDRVLVETYAKWGGASPPTLAAARRLQEARITRTQGLTGRDEDSFSQVAELLLAHYEHIASGITNGAFDIECLNDVTGGRILRNMSSLLAIRFRELRRPSPRRFDQTNSMTQQLYSMSKGTFRLDPSIELELEALLSPMEGLEVWQNLHSWMEDARSHVFTSTQDLMLSVSRYGGLPFLNTIKRVTRQQPFSIEDYLVDVHRNECIQIFDETLQRTSGVWPVLRSDEKLSDWFDHTEASHRFVVTNDRTVCGYVELVTPSTRSQNSYWESALEKLASPLGEFGHTDPSEYGFLARGAVGASYLGSGLGRALVSHAIDRVQTLTTPDGRAARIPALTVMNDEKLSTARTLYTSLGGVAAGQYLGKDGRRQMDFIVF